MSKIVEQTLWLTIEEASKKLKITTKAVKDLVNDFYFVVNDTGEMVSDASLDEYIVTKKKARLEDEMKLRKEEQAIELQRAKLEAEIEGLNPDSLVDQDKRKELEDKLNSLPKSKYKESAFMRKHKGEVWLRTMSHYGLMFEAGEPLTEVGVLYLEQILLKQSPNSNLKKYIGSPEAFELKQERFRRLAYKD